MDGRIDQASDGTIVSSFNAAEISLGLVSSSSFTPDYVPQAGIIGSRDPERTAFDQQPREAKHKLYVEIDSMVLSDFVRSKFIPEYVETRRSSGQAHFRAILKHLISPSLSSPDCADVSANKTVKGQETKLWPYLGSLTLRDIDESTVRNLTTVVLESGYSIQTASHIRNVIRAIFSHARSAYGYTGTNPAAFVELPKMVRKDTAFLTLQQVKRLIPAMRYPERPIALLALFTDLTVAEICGLKWQDVNVSTNSALMEAEWLPPKTIAVRNQVYRGVFEAVTAGRKRSIPIPERLLSMLRHQKTRRRFTNPEDFVVASQAGTAVHPENVAARRLKLIGKAQDVPWLSWSAFRRTSARWKSELDDVL